MLGYMQHEYASHPLELYISRWCADSMVQFGAHLDGSSAASARIPAGNGNHIAAKKGKGTRRSSETGRRSMGSADAEVTSDSLTPSAHLADMTDSQYVELVREMLDGPGRVDLIMEFFGLTRCKGTNVGNQMMRGISGGERKRLSTVEMLMGGQQVLMLDEISTGLVRGRLHSEPCRADAKDRILSSVMRKSLHAAAVAWADRPLHRLAAD